MSDYVYNKEARELDDQLEEVLETQAEPSTEPVEEPAPKEAGLLDRIAAGLPSETVRGYSLPKTAGDDLIREHLLRRRIQKVAAQGNTLVDGFLESVKKD